MFSQTTFPEETIASGVFIAKFIHALAKHDGIDNQSQTVLWMLKKVWIMCVETALFGRDDPP